MWNNLSDKGFIYKGVYDGWYCVNDENFLTDIEVCIRRISWSILDTYLYFSKDRGKNR